MYFLRDVFLDSGAKEVDWNSHWEIAWVDGNVPVQRFTKRKPFQRINHFPGMSEICRKDRLVINLKRMKSILPELYDFFPVTFCLPDESLKLLRYCERRNFSDVFIMKPYCSSQGCGIDLVKGFHRESKYRNFVCQKYIARPFLFNGYKFDLRLYALITSVSPLRVYAFDEGLVRLATIPYKIPTASNMKEKRMHLTNYSVNGKPEEKESTLQGSCKTSLSELKNYLGNKGSVELWTSIDDIIVKTILSALPALQHIFHISCPFPSAISPYFEILGFDILLDENLKPYLLEVNRSPSLGGSTFLDKALKSQLIKNTISMVLLSEKQIHVLKNEDHLKSVRRLTNSNTMRQLSAREQILADYQPKQEERMRGHFRRLYPDDHGKFENIKNLAYSFSSHGDPCNVTG